MATEPGASGPRRALAGAFAALLACAASSVLPATATAGHGLEALLDHPVPAFSEGGDPGSGLISGGNGAAWDLIKTFPTANPHTDLDFFEQDGEIFAAVGTLAVGPNGGGQTLIKLTEGGEVDPSFVSGHPSASCLSEPSAALGLQHDVEAAPKGDVIFNTDFPSADTSDAQLLIDATDAPGRCHDQGIAGISEAPRGGLEVIDITDVENPVEIGLISHIGQSHTVNVDPKRPHIAFSVTSDSVQTNPDGTRQNRFPTSATDTDRFDLDGFELVDLSSCMDFPEEATREDKRTGCRPEVYRYQYPTTEDGLGHTAQGAVNGCHEVEIYPDDTLTCASISVSTIFDMSGAFDDMGTPNDYTDDKPLGTPLPCEVRETTTPGPPAPFTGAKVTDCVDGTGGPGSEALNVPNWVAAGAPSLEGVEIEGIVHHMGRGGGLPSAEDVDVSHEAELTHSGNILLATDERGGGVVPPDASCSPGVDNPAGNGGIHAYTRDDLTTTMPATVEEAQAPYALTPAGKKAVFRLPIRTAPQSTFCTSHVFHQIPGENRIFMGWYSQGTAVVDYFENPDGTFVFQDRAHFIPEGAVTWTSAIFKLERNREQGTVTYYGATGDLGRSAIDVYEVTLPLPPEPPTPPDPDGPPPEIGDCETLFMGTDGNDTFRGLDTGDRIRGLAGRDTIRGRGGNDCLFGHAGRDLIKGNAGDDLIKGGKHRDVLGGNAGADKMHGNAGRDIVKGGGGDDRLRGGKARDRISGQSGDDRINVRGGGRDRVRCGAGEDTVRAGKRDRIAGNCERVILP